MKNYCTEDRLMIGQTIEHELVYDTIQDAAMSVPIQKSNLSFLQTRRVYELAPIPGARRNVSRIAHNRYGRDFCERNPVYRVELQSYVVTRDVGLVRELYAPAKRRWDDFCQRCARAEARAE